MKDIGLILGIRSDVIRASKVIKLLHENNDIDFDFIWSGQHYSENMKDVFFNLLNDQDIASPSIFSFNNPSFNIKPRLFLACLQCVSALL